MFRRRKYECWLAPKCGIPRKVGLRKIRCPVAVITPFKEIVNSLGCRQLSIKWYSSSGLTVEIIEKRRSDMRHGAFFKNRADAAQQLADLLEPKYKHLNPLVLGIPRGGVEVAYYVAKQLDAELSVVISKKLPYPGHEEYGFGAVSEDYSVYVAPHGQKTLEPKAINIIVEEQIKEIKRRVEKYRNGEPLPDMKGRTVIIVDDGIATGVTLVPIIKLCRKKEAGRIVIAAPVSGTTFDEHLHEADDMEILVQPEQFYAVGQVYETFGDFYDDQVLGLLREKRPGKSAKDL